MNDDDLDFGASLRGLSEGQHVFNRYALLRDERKNYSGFRLALHYVGK